MEDKLMYKLLRTNKAKDVRQFGYMRSDGVLSIHKFYGPNYDYCDALQEKWILSIGKSKDGNMFAAYDNRFINNPDYECIWNRQII